MNIVEAVKRYVVDRYPIESSWSAWRSGESIAAVALLTQRVTLGNAAGLQTAVSYLADRTPAVGDPPVAALREISRTTLTGSESRLYAMLLDVKAALAFPADFVVAHAEKVWRANSLFCLVGAHDDTLDAKGWIAYFFMERQQWNHVPQRSKEWMVDFLNVFYDRPVQLALANGGAGPGLASAFNATTFLQTHELPERMDGAQTVMARMESYTPIQITHAYRPKADVFEEAMVVALRSGFMPIAECTDRAIVGPPRLAQVQLHTAWRTNPAWGGSAAAAQAFAATFVRQTAVVSYCWRGDGRPYGEIRDARGLWCKAASQVYAERTKMREAWHPFHREEYRRHIYYRCNQNDNCLFTAVSVTPAVTIGGVGNTFQFANPPDLAAFQINVTFPQLSTIPLAKRQRVHVARTGTGANAGQNDAPQLYVDHVQLYLCRMPALSNYVDTRALQIALAGAGFPEIALRGIDAADLMGYITFMRVHHGDGDEDGFTAIPVADRSRNLQPNVAAAANLYNAANQQFEIAWGANGPVPPRDIWTPAPPGGWTVTRVGPMNVNAGRIANWVNY